MFKCECGNKKMESDIFCKRCAKEIEDKFNKIIVENFTIEEIEYIDEVIEGYYLTELLFKNNGGIKNE